MDTGGKTCPKYFHLSKTSHTSTPPTSHNGAYRPSGVRGIRLDQPTYLTAVRFARHTQQALCAIIGGKKLSDTKPLPGGRRRRPSTCERCCAQPCHAAMQQGRECPKFLKRPLLFSTHCQVTRRLSITVRPPREKEECLAAGRHTHERQRWRSAPGLFEGVLVPLLPVVLLLLAAVVEAAL